MTGRKRGRIIVRNNGIYTHIDNNGTDYGSTPLETYEHEYCYDEVIDRYHSRSRKGELFFNSLQYGHVSLNTTGDGAYYAFINSDPTINWTGTGLVTSHHAAICGIDTQSLILLTEQLDEEYYVDGARQNCLAEIDKSPYPFMEDLFELRETIQFLRNPAAAIQSAARVFNKRIRDAHKIKDSLRRAKALASIWNQYRFALSPLVRSMLSALEAYNNREEDAPPQRQTARGFRNHKVRDANTDYEHVYSAGATFTFEVAEERKIDVHAALMYEIDNPLHDWKFQLGLRLKDIPETAWQIVPLSFMVDRIWNISNAIRGVTNLIDPKISFLGGTTTIRTREYSRKSIKSQDSPGATISITPDVVEYTYFTMRRVKWVPSVSDTIPTTDLRYIISDAEKILDLLAISLSLLKI